MSIKRAVCLVTAAVLGASLLLAAPASADDTAITNTVAPTITGTAQFGRTLTAVPGTWAPADVTVSYQWLRDGQPVGADSPVNTTRELASTYDVGKVFSVRVTGTREGAEPVSATSDPTVPVAKATFSNTVRPVITGTPTYGSRLTGSSGRWSRTPDAYDYRWLRDDKPIAGATTRHHRIGVSDVGAKIRFRVTAKRKAYVSHTARSKAVTGQHVRAVRKVVTYDVTTRGSITTSLATFRQQAQQTYDDPRGWRAMGVRFERVSSGGDFTLVLSEASRVPSFSSACSTTYSCRVGRHVIINQTRWKRATPAWDREDGSLRGYRHMVVNHETGHWFGRGHASCGGSGQLAPVMQQQSKGLAGCRINPWPKPSELHAPRYGW